ncbi:MAG: hypothetical protein JSU83_14800 [Deltaproteobacteria bacterium]|nr:MAG: hypothetical protein JSU83_14800 [Deltaproteobacteria bacterium]
MKILHILRSEPNEMVMNFIRETSKNAVSLELPIYGEEVDYDQLVTEIFASDKVISWW